MAPHCTPGLRELGSHSERPASSSSLLFSCGRIKSFAHLPFDRLAERVLTFFMEGDAFHRNFFDGSVVEFVAFTQEVGTLLRVLDHGNHAVGGANNSV